MSFPTPEDPPDREIGPVSPALAGGFFTLLHLRRAEPTLAESPFKSPVSPHTHQKHQEELSYVRGSNHLFASPLFGVYFCLPSDSNKSCFFVCSPLPCAVSLITNFVPVSHFLSGRSPRGGNGNPLHYSCLENLGRGGWWGPWGRKESDMTEHPRTPAPKSL